MNTNETLIKRGDVVYVRREFGPGCKLSYRVATKDDMKRLTKWKTL